MNENNFKAFQQVLVRNNNKSKWHGDLFSHAIRENVCGDYYACVGGNFVQCIPYNGNEHLLGTTDEPKPKRWRANKGEYFYFIDETGAVSKTDDLETDADNILFNIGNYYRTKEEAEAMAEKFKALLKEG